MITNEIQNNEIKITIALPRSTDVSNHMFLVSSLNINDAIREALVKLKASVILEKRATPLLQIILPKDYTFTITTPTDLGLELGPRTRISKTFSISARHIEEAVDQAIQNEGSWKFVQRDKAIFESTINHIAGIDDGTWPNGEESKMTPEIEKEMSALGNEVKAKFVENLKK